MENPASEPQPEWQPWVAALVAVQTDWPVAERAP